MSDITREDAAKWLANLREDCGRYQGLWHYAEALDQIIELLSADVAQVVRCKDCKHFRTFHTASDGEEIRACFGHGIVDLYYDDFCSKGERKDNEL